jgi:uncharacterized protein
MYEKKAEAATETQENKKKDRKLGDEWADWSGDPRDQVINEKPSTFLILGSVVFFVMLLLFLFAWYMIEPRVEQLSPLAAHIGGYAAIGLTALFLVLVIIEGLVLRSGKSLFPYRLVEKFLVTLLPKAVWLGGKFGTSRDRIGNSFIKIHNFITKTSASGGLSAERLLVLLPRCLKKEARNEIASRITGDSSKIYTAAGGEEAREAIIQYRPTCILAIACERDLMGGIKDVAEKIPVLAIANKRPEGPCKNTDFSVADLEEALKAFKENKVERLN